MQQQEVVKKNMASPDWANGLPDNAMELIFSCREDLKSAREVCRNWEAGYNRTISKVTATEASDWMLRDSPEPGAFAAKFPFAHTVDFSKIFERKAGVPPKALNRPLLTLEDSQITTMVIREGDMLTDRSMKIIGRMASLTKLDVKGSSEITDRGVAHLKVKCDVVYHSFLLKKEQRSGLFDVRYLIGHITDCKKFQLGPQLVFALQDPKSNSLSFFYASLQPLCPYIHQ